MPEGVNETLFQLFPEDASTRLGQMAFPRGFGIVCLRQNGLDVSDAGERDEHGEKAESVEKEISGHAEERHGKAAKRWTEHARHIELRRVERDGVGEIFSRHKLRHQR